MKRLAVCLFVIAWLVALAGPAAAVDVGGEIFFQYSYLLPTYDSDFDPRAVSNDYNAFDLPRARLTLAGEPYPLWYAFLGTDVERVSGLRADVDGDGDLETVDNPDEGRLQLVLRYARLTWRAREYFGIEGGLIDTPWITHVERANGFRFVDRLLTERVGWNGEISDLGVAFLGEFPGGRGDYHVQAVNGDGGQSFEANKQKAACARVTVMPWLAGEQWLSLSVGGRYHENDDPENTDFSRDAVFAGMLHFRGARLNLGVETSFDYHWRTEDDDPSSLGMAGTGWLSVKTLPWLEPFVRAERLDPDLDYSGRGRGASLIDGDRLRADEDGQWRLLGGLGFYPAHKIKAALSGRVVTYDEKYDTGPDAGDPIAPAAELRASLAFEI